MIISLVVALSRNGVIGNKDHIPWRIRSDLVRLKELTLGHPVIIGRTSYDSMVGYYAKSGRPMPGSVYIVVTHNKDYIPTYPNAVIAHSVPQAITLAEQQRQAEAFVIGGAQIYQQTLPHAQRLYLTRIEANATGDAFFPAYNPAEWRQVYYASHQKDEKNQYDYTFITYHRV